MVANPVSGGSGGSAYMDGISGTEMSVAFLRNVPVEVLESEAPVLVRRFGLCPDTEGAGRFRGGFGSEYDLQIRHPAAVVVMRGKDRHRFCAWGAAGGRAATTSGNVGERPGAAPHDIGKQTVYRPAMDEVIRIWSGGGGGWGDPLERDPEKVLADVAAGLVSSERAHAVYGVAITQGRVQAAETEARRAELRERRGALPAFDFGPGALGIRGDLGRGRRAHRRLAPGPGRRRAPLRASRGVPAACARADPARTMRRRRNARCARSPRRCEARSGGKRDEQQPSCFGRRAEPRGADRDHPRRRHRQHHRVV